MISDANTIETVSGIINYITYKNDANGYAVFELSSNNDKLTCVGVLPNIEIGESVRLCGNYSLHPSYGRQFKFESFEITAPEGTAAILRYLSSGVIKGIGPSTARKLVEKFGSDTLDILENHPQKVSTLKGISIKKAEDMAEQMKKHQGIREVMIFFSKYGINPEYSNRIYRKLGNKTVEIIKSNPYLLCDEDIGFSFEKASDFAENFDIANNNFGRIEAGINYVIRHNLGNGHTCLPKSKLLEISSKLLQCSHDDICSVFDDMCSSFRLKTVTINGEDFVFFLKYYTSETYIASKLKIMSECRHEPLLMQNTPIETLQSELNITYEEKQKIAIETAVQKGLLVLTGGPGTGKTTTLKGIINLLENSNFEVVLTAPTGRAAQRMSELTGKEAKTIHRLLEVEWDENDNQAFARNERNPLTCDALIIDEMSMVDSLLFEALLRAIPIGCRLIMVGDTDQLPSVGAGNVLGDIIQSGILPVVQLNEVFRQAMESLIVTNAHRIVEGEYPLLDIKDKDMFMIDIKNPDAAADYVVDLCCRRLPNAYGYSCFSDIQVLCPSKKTQLGTININNLLQDRLNPHKKDVGEIEFRGYRLRVGDRVMQIKNNYDIEWKRDNGEEGLGIFNGDIGILEDINIVSGKITVRYDDKVAFYSTEDFNQLELSYAVTVHKSQGSEFECVVLPLIDTPLQLCYRNILYTAITRAKKQLIIVGNRDTVFKMTDNNRKTLRYTGLLSFLNDE